MLQHQKSLQYDANCIKKSQQWEIITYNKIENVNSLINRGIPHLKN